MGVRNEISAWRRRLTWARQACAEYDNLKAQIAETQRETAAQQRRADALVVERDEQANRAKMLSSALAELTQQKADAEVAFDLKLQDYAARIDGFAQTTAALEYSAQEARNHVDRHMVSVGQQHSAAMLRKQQELEVATAQVDALRFDLKVWRRFALGLAVVMGACVILLW